MSTRDAEYAGIRFEIYEENGTEIKKESFLYLPARYF